MARRSQVRAKKPKLELELEEPIPGANTPGPSQPSFATLFALRHAELWFADGNLIVGADGISFRVYAGILERHSPVFRQLLNDLQSEDGSAKSVDGCRLLRVADKGADLAEMFSVLYDGGKGGFFDWRKPIQFNELRRITMIAIKYKVEHIIKEAVARLEFLFPITFPSARLGAESYVGDVEGSPLHCPELGCCIGAAALARAIDSENPPPFIAMALYHCCQICPDQLFLPEVYDGEKVCLSHDDFVLCLQASRELVIIDRGAKAPILDALDNPKCDSNTCHAGLEQLVRDWARKGGFGDYNPLSTSGRVFNAHAKAWPDRKPCYRCQGDLLKEIDERRQKVFNKLGKIFKIPTWPVQA